MLHSAGKIIASLSTGTSTLVEWNIFCSKHTVPCNPLASTSSVFMVPSKFQSSLSPSKTSSESTIFGELLLHQTTATGRDLLMVVYHLHFKSALIGDSGTPGKMWASNLELIYCQFCKIWSHFFSGILGLVGDTHFPLDQGASRD